MTNSSCPILSLIFSLLLWRRRDARGYGAGPLRPHRPRWWSERELVPVPRAHHQREWGRCRHERHGRGQPRGGEEKVAVAAQHRAVKLPREEPPEPPDNPEQAALASQGRDAPIYGLNSGMFLCYCFVWCLA
jgi:hypothetical protein